MTAAHHSLCRRAGCARDCGDAGPRRALRRKRRLAAVIVLVAACICLSQAGWIHAKAWLAQALIDRAFARASFIGDSPQPSLGDSPQWGSRPWPWADTRPIARLHLPGAHRPLVVLSGSSGRNLAFAPTHEPASVLPGEPGNSIISAHRDTHFRALASLAVGDQVEIERVGGRKLIFEVTAVDVIDSRHARMALDTDGPRLTLVTCYPFEAIDPGGPLRLVVTALPAGEL